MDHRGKLNVAFLLPYEANFHSGKGGAVVQWVGEIVKRSHRYSYTVIAKRLDNNSKFDRPVCSWIGRMGFKTYSSRTALGGFLWCLLNIRHWWGKNTIIVENRPEYAVFMRQLGFTGRIFLHVHNDIFGDLNYRYLSEINQSVNAIIVCSRSLLVPLQERHSDLCAKSKVIHNGVDGSVFRRNGSNSDGRIIILFVGRLEKNKGPLLIVEAYRKIFKECSHAELHLVGDWGNNPDSKYVSEIKAAIRECNSSGGKIVCHGYVSHDQDLPYLYSSASIFCFCSTQSEAFPMVVIEAMSSQLCVVAAAIGGVPEALGDAGLLFSPGNEQDLQEKLLMALKDGNLRQRLAENARNRATKLFSLSSIVGHFEDALDHVN